MATERGVATYANGRFVPLRLPADANLPRIFAITTSGEDVWLRDFYFRLHRWRDGRLLPVDDIPDPFRKNLLALHADRRGRLWLGGAGGQLGLRQADGTFTSRQLPIGGIVRLYSDMDGTLWAGGDEGMSRIAGSEVVTLTRAQGFPGSVKSIVEDRRGDLWIGVGTGIVRVEKSQFMRAALDPATRLRYRFFNAADGVAGIPIAEGTCTGVRGRRWAHVVRHERGRHGGRSRPGRPAAGDAARAYRVGHRRRAEVRSAVGAARGRRGPRTSTSRSRP